MPACRSTEQIARCQRDGYLFTMDCLTPGEVHHHGGCLKAEREQGDALGTNEYGNFDLKPRPASDFDPASRVVHAAVVTRSFDSSKLLTMGWRSGNVRI